MSGQVPFGLGTDGYTVARPLAGRLAESAAQVESAPASGRELAERMRKTAERLQQVRASAKALIREVRTGTPSP